MEQLNKSKILDWIISYAISHRLLDVIHEVLSEKNIDVLCGVNKTVDVRFDYPRYLFVWHVIDNIEKIDVLKNVNLLQHSIKTLDILYCKSHRVPFLLFLSLFTSLKLITAVSVFKTSENPDAVVPLVLDYFPMESRDCRTHIAFKYKLRRTVGSQMQELFTLNAACRVRILDEIVHGHSESKSLELEKVGTKMKRELEQFLELETKDSCDESVIDKLLSGDADDVKSKFATEVDYVQETFQQNFGDSVEQVLILILRSLTCDLSQVDVDSDEMVTEPSDSDSLCNSFETECEMTDSQTLVSEMQAGSSNRPEKAEEDTEDASIAKTSCH